jgi:hypothetical protein
VGSGSPKYAREEVPAHHSKHNSGEVEQFSFQRNEILNEQSLNTENGDFGDFVIQHKMFRDENPKRLTMDIDSSSDLSDYNDNFAEEYRLK